MTTPRLSISVSSIALALSLAVGAWGNAYAFDGLSDAVDVEVDGQASAVAAVTDDGDVKGDGDLDIRVIGSTILPNGLEVGAGVSARVDGDQPGHMWGAGRYSGALIGGPRGVGPLNSDAYLQSAYAYVRGGFGEIAAGRESGVARTLAITSPTIFTAVGVNDWRTDVTGLNDVHTVNDFSGYSTKFSYMPPANFLGGVLGGLQLGVSYTPSLKECGAAACAPSGGFADSSTPGLPQEIAWRDVVEAALYYQKELRLGGGEGIKIGLGASYVTANEQPDLVGSVLGGYDSYSVGLNLAYRGFTLGGSVKSTNAGFAEFDRDGYLAFDAGLTYEAGQWGFMVGYGSSDAGRDASNPLNPAFFRQTQAAQAGVTYLIGRGITIGAAAQYVTSDKPDAIGGNEDAAALIFESSIKF